MDRRKIGSTAESNFICPLPKTLIPDIRNQRCSEFLVVLIPLSKFQKLYHKPYVSSKGNSSGLVLNIKPKRSASSTFFWFKKVILELERKANF